jgi:ClpP class serine protease
MADRVGSFALWAMVPEMIGEVQARGTIEGMVPDGLRGLLGFAGGQAAAAPDPIRDGATVVLPVVGTLSPRGQYGAGGDTGRLADRVREFGADPKIGAIVLNMMTPGGLVYGTAEAGDAIFEVRQSKPIVAVANNWMVASAGYWLATQASEFYASPSSDVGSVGVYAGHTDMSRARAEARHEDDARVVSPRQDAGQFVRAAER